MKNLSYVKKETRDEIERILSDPSVHSLTKDIIRAGLNKDSLDAVSDVELALNVLKKVCDDCLGL